MAAGMLSHIEAGYASSCCELPYNILPFLKIHPLTFVLETFQIRSSLQPLGFSHAIQIRKWAFRPIGASSFSRYTNLYIETNKSIYSKFGNTFNSEYDIPEINHKPAYEVGLFKRVRQSPSSGTVVASIVNMARHLCLPRVDLSTNIKKYGELCK